MPTRERALKLRKASERRIAKRTAIVLAILSVFAFVALSQSGSTAQAAKDPEYAAARRAWVVPSTVSQRTNQTSLTATHDQRSLRWTALPTVWAHASI